MQKKRKCRRRCANCNGLKPAEDFIKHGAKCRLCRRVERRAAHERDPRKAMLDSARRRAAKTGLKFALRLDDLVVPKRCPYLGLALRPNGKTGSRDSSPSLDRIDPRRGYEAGNVQITSLAFNRAKGSLAPDQLVRMAKSILKLHRR